MLYYEFARGIDNRPVEAVRIRKSVGCEHTLEKRYLPQILCYHRALSRSDRTYRQAGTFRIQGKHTDL